MINSWTNTTIGEFCPFSYGKGLPEKKRVSGEISVYGSNGIIGTHNDAFVFEEGIIIGRKGSIGEIFFSPTPFWPIDTTFYVVGSNSRDTRFTYYLLKTLGLDQMNSDSAVPGLNRDAAHKIQILVPPLPEQRAIADILGALDDKIELNRRMNQTLEELAQTLFKHWFIDNPERAKWKEGCLGDAIEIYDSKRIPLSSRERSLRKGIFPYHGAASIMDYIDNFIFDGIYLLIAEDGSVSDDKDNPVLQYVSGKFWVNNHAHIVQGKGYFSTEYILNFLKQINISPYITGAVQPKLNQENLKRIPFIFPPESEVNMFNKKANNLFSLLRSNIEQSQTLAKLRDILLPKLMSGQVRVKP